MSILKRLLREPLLHFLLIGAGLFWMFYEVAEPGVDRPNQIVVSRADIERLKTQWQRQWRRPPTEQELKGMIESHVREMVLYREALALGLDQDDVIVRRRLGQKLEFMFKDLAEQVEPDDTELERYLKENGDRYTESGRYTFTHVYLSTDKRGAATARDGRELLEQLQTSEDPPDPTRLGDRFLYQYQFDQQSIPQISRIFGELFVDNLVDLESGRWQGPIESGYGLHLVYIAEKSAPRQPQLAEIRDKVRWDVIAERRKQMDASFYTELKRRYEVIIEQQQDADNPLASNSTQ